MQVASKVAVALAVLVGTAAIAADKPFTVALSGWGRACAGALFVRTRTIEWNTRFVTCKPSTYEVLDKDLDGDHKRIAFRLLKPGKGCIYTVIEAELPPVGAWNVTGYQSLEAYQKRHLPEWFYSTMPERNWLSCPMEERN